MPHPVLQSPSCMNAKVISECLFSWIWQNPPKVVSMSLLQVTTSAENSLQCSLQSLPYCPSIRPGPFLQSPFLPGSSSIIFCIFYYQESELSHGWDSWFLVPACSVSNSPLCTASSLGCPWHHFPYLHFPTVDFGHINLHSVLLSSGLITFVSKIPLPQGLCTGCPWPRMFFLQFPEHDCLSFEIFA